MASLKVQETKVGPIAQALSDLKTAALQGSHALSGTHGTVEIAGHVKLTY